LYSEPISCSKENPYSQACDNHVIQRTFRTCVGISYWSALKTAVPKYILRTLHQDRADTTTGDDETCHYDMKDQFGHPMLAYAASKSMALDATKDFMKAQQPSFDLVELMPAFVFGPNPLARTPEEFIHGSNSVLLNHLLGNEGTGLMSASVHIDDVAKCHVQSLDRSISAGRYLLASDTTNWEEVIPVVKKYFPQAVGTTFVDDAEVKELKIVCDNEKAEKTFGLKFKSFEEQVKSAVGYYLGLVSK